MIDEKIQLLSANQTREMDLYEIAERAIQDKDLNEKNWRKIFLTHIFVNKMLRNKIEKEMEKFRTVEFAFKEIKTATVLNTLFRESMMQRIWCKNISTRKQFMVNFWARLQTTRRLLSTWRIKLKTWYKSQRTWRWIGKFCNLLKSSHRTCMVSILTCRSHQRTWTIWRKSDQCRKIS